METHYVLLDCDKVQDYIFSSVRLREICGASILLKKLETEVIPKLVDSQKGQTIRAGGGVVLCKFESQEKVRDFLREVQKKYYERGVSVTSVQKRVQTITDFYSEVLEPLFINMKEKKDSPDGVSLQTSSILLVPCENCGIDPSEKPVKLPDGEERRMSRKEAAKSNSQKNVFLEEKLAKKFKIDIANTFEDIVGINNDERQIALDQPGTSENRFLGIVYADINGLGKTATAFSTDENKYELFCKDVNDCIDLALSTACEKITTQVVGDIAPDSSRYLPFKILYIGGDDLAVAVQGRYALTFARELIKELEEESSILFSSQGDSLTMSAGIVIAPYNYPIKNFNLIGKGLEESAKSAGRHEQRENSLGMQPSLIDFCLIKNNEVGDIEQIRKNMTTDRDLFLNGGPYTMQEIIDLQDAASSLINKEFPKRKLNLLEQTYELSGSYLDKGYVDWRSRLADKQEIYMQVCKKLQLDASRLASRTKYGKNITSIIDLIDVYYLSI